MPINSQASPSFWAALNPPIYLVSILPGLAVIQFSQATGPAVLMLALATVAVVLIQHSVNLLNDVSDWKLGADENKMDSWVRFHQSTRVAANHGGVSFVIGAALGLLALLGAQKLWVLMYALPFVALGSLYNHGKKPLSYTALGEWITGICYGPGVVGALWLMSAAQNLPVALLLVLSFASLSVSLLLSHQPPQIESDRAAGKLSFAVRHGKTKTTNSAQALFVVFVFSLSSAHFFIFPTMFAALNLISAVAISLYALKRSVNPKNILLAAMAVIAMGGVLGGLSQLM